MPYKLKFVIYPLIAGAIAFVAAGVLTPLGRAFNLLFAVVATYLTIMIGRRVFGRKNL